MQRFLLTAALVLATTFCFAQPKPAMSDKKIIQELKEHPYRAACGLAPYYWYENIPAYTPAPDGFKPFYVSHLSRHGSRNHGSHNYAKILNVLDSLHNAGALTPQGDSLRTEIQILADWNKTEAEMLTRRGAAEHTGIAKRLAARCPEVFDQPDRRIVMCTATRVQRTIQSMAGFVAGISAANPGLEFSIGSDLDFNTKFNLPKDKKLSKDETKAIFTPVEEKFAMDAKSVRSINRRLFKGYNASEQYIYDLLHSASIAGCLDLAVDPFRFFTPEELLAYCKKRDVYYSASYGTLDIIRDRKAKNGRQWAAKIVEEADAAIAGNGHCADLRFGHDGDVGPLMNLLQLGAYVVTARSESPLNYWQSYNQICMASNIQFEFYANPGKEILVKAVFNEREVLFPTLTAVNGVFYKWEDVRGYMLDKCGL